MTYHPTHTDIETGGTVEMKADPYGFEITDANGLKWYIGAKEAADLFKPIVYSEDGTVLR